MLMCMAPLKTTNISKALPEQALTESALDCDVDRVQHLETNLLAEQWIACSPHTQPLQESHQRWQSPC